MSEPIPTRFIIVSDTHGKQLKHHPPGQFDVAIHCGDLTEESKLAEFKTTLEVMKKINAPLKLIIAGNHDWTLDTPVFKQKLAAIKLDADDEAVKREYGGYGDAMALLQSEEAKRNGIEYLSEGTHRFTLANGALLIVYASPYTPSLDEWGFNYDPITEHDWNIDNDVDVAITHCPPRGVLDIYSRAKRGGSPELFAAVARARPKLHCFGHMHANWGAKKVCWRGEEASAEPSHFTEIDSERSGVVETWATVRAREFDKEEIVEEKRGRRERYERQGYCGVEDLRLEKGRETLFVNAAIEGEEAGEQHFPWAVEIGLPRAKAQT